jgi:hypothetical protein
MTHAEIQAAIDALMAATADAQNSIVANRPKETPAIEAALVEATAGALVALAAKRPVRPSPNRPRPPSR